MSAQDTEVLYGGLLHAAEHTPHNVALISDTQSFTFADIVSRARVLSIYFAQHQAKRVALCLPNCPAVIDTFFGTLMAGGCVCLFDPGWPAALLRGLVQDHKPDVLVLPDGTGGDLKAQHESMMVMSPEDLAAVLEAGTSAHVAGPEPDTTFLLGFTSGSSGPPKGFIRSHQTWTESFRHSALELGTSADDCVLAPGPLSHGLSLYAVIEALCAGATAIIRSEFDATGVLTAAARHQATTLVVVPAMLDVLLAERSGESYPDLKRIVTAGAKLPPSLRHRAANVFPNAEIIEYYGASELSFITVAKGAEVCPPDSVGRPFSGVEIEIRDARGAAVKADEVGTVWVKSGMLCSGYVGPTDGSGMRTDGAWATVGDFGHLDADGYLFLDGREGSGITSAGYTVYPSAIEAVLLDHPGIADAAVIGLPHERWGEVIAAAVILDQEADLSQEDVSAYCRDKLEPYACPRRWVFASALTRTPSGKVDRAALAALFTSND